MKHRLVSLVWMVALAVSLLCGQPAPVYATGFVVDDPTDDPNAHDKNPGDSICASWYNTCTLRAAVEEANALAGPDTITFDNQFPIPTIIHLDPNEGMLNISSQIRLDASSLWDTVNDRPGISLDGGDRSVNCIGIYGANVEIYGLFISNCSTAIAIYKSYNTIGRSLPGYRNVLSGNASSGVYLGTVNAHHNVVQGNWIGLSITGDTKAPNYAGVTIHDKAHDNTIGGYQAAQGNYISGNTTHGIVIQATNTDGNLVGANTIGLPAVGYLDVGNGSTGITIANGVQNTRIGGSGLIGNTISKNGREGVSISSAHNTLIEGNIIELNTYGVRVSEGAGNRIVENTIAYQSKDGIFVQGAAAIGNTMIANSIHDNDLKGIELQDGGNSEVAAPIITTADATGVWGTSCPWCLIHVYSDTSDEGLIYHGWANADGSGAWSWIGSLDGPNVTATTTEPCGQETKGGELSSVRAAATATCGDTSEFSAAYFIGNHAPNTPANPSPADGATGVSATPTLTWTGGDVDGDMVMYTVYGQEASAVLSDVWCNGSTSTACQPAFAFKANTKYNWFVSADDQKGGQVNGPFWEFTTGGGATLTVSGFLPVILK